MNTIVDQLLETDRQAKQILDNARQYHSRTIEEIAEEKNRLRNMFQERANQRVEQLQQAEDQHVDEDTTAITSRCEQLVRQLEEVYEQNHKVWEDELYARCITAYQSSEE